MQSNVEPSHKSPSPAARERVGVRAVREPLSRQIRKTGKLGTGTYPSLVFKAVEELLPV